MLLHISVILLLPGSSLTQVSSVLSPTHIVVDKNNQKYNRGESKRGTSIISFSSHRNGMRQEIVISGESLPSIFPLAQRFIIQACRPRQNAASRASTSIEAAVQAAAMAAQNNHAEPMNENE